MDWCNWNADSRGLFWPTLNTVYWIIDASLLGHWHGCCWLRQHSFSTASDWCNSSLLRRANYSSHSATDRGFQVICLFETFSVSGTLEETCFMVPCHAVSVFLLFIWQVWIGLLLVIGMLPLLMWGQLRFLWRLRATDLHPNKFRPNLFRQYHVVFGILSSQCKWKLGRLDKWMQIFRLQLDKRFRPLATHPGFCWEFGAFVPWFSSTCTSAYLFHSWAFRNCFRLSIHLKIYQHPD